MSLKLFLNWRFFIAVVGWSFLFLQTLSAQVFEGRIIDEEGMLVFYATIYIEETKGGCTTDESGFFSMKLPVGTYTIKVQHISYSTKIQMVTIPLQQPLLIQMETKSILLSEAEVRVNKEDPAYNIMRRAIAKAPYYRQQLSSYQAELYNKATLYIDKIPRIVKLIAKKAIENENFTIKVGDVYTRESVSELQLENDSLSQRVISIKSSFPEQFEAIQIDDFGMYNIYDRTGAFISPLSAKALSVYKFWLESTSYNDYGKTIYHIKVTPKNNNPYAFKGYVDIVDSSWHVHYFDLSAKIDYTVFSFDFNIKENFSELEKDIWIPIGYYANLSMEGMGMKGRTRLSGSLKYSKYVVNQRISGEKPGVEYVEEKPFVISEKSKQIETKIQKLTEKEKLTNKDALKIVSLLEAKDKEDEKNNPPREMQNTLEIKDRSFVSIDSMAYHRDSLYWAENRKLPLSEEEEQSYINRKIADSIAQSKSNFLPTRKPVDDFSKRTYSYGFDIPKELVAFNTVDGWKFKLSGYLNKRFKDTTVLRNKLALGYSLEQKHVLFEASSRYVYYPEKRASIAISGGAETFDFNNEWGVSPLINTISSLFFRENYINFYYRSHFSVDHEIELFNGFDTHVSFSYEWRKELQNETDYSFFYRDTRDYRSNIPNNPYLANNPSAVASGNASLLSVWFSYTPQRHYYFSERTKRRSYSHYPTFSVLWKKGIPNLFNSVTNFDYLQLRIHQNFNFGVLQRFSFDVYGGWFPNNKNMHFSEYKQFQIYESPLMFKGFNGIYHTMKTYEAATNEWMVSAFLKYETPYLALKYIPGLNKTIITENLYLSYLQTPFMKDYLELGYSLNNIWLLGYVGVFVGFDNFSYANWSLKIAVNLTDF